MKTNDSSQPATQPSCVFLRLRRVARWLGAVATLSVAALFLTAGPAQADDTTVAGNLVVSGTAEFQANTLWFGTNSSWPLLALSGTAVNTGTTALTLTAFQPQSDWRWEQNGALANNANAPETLMELDAGHRLILFDPAHPEDENHGITLDPVSGQIRIGGTSVLTALGSAIALGSGANANGQLNAVAIGNASCTSGCSVAIGQGAQANWGATAIGFNAKAVNALCTAFGYGSIADGYANTAIGFGATTSSTCGFAVSIGDNTSATGNSSVALGESTLASGPGANAFGNYSTASGYSSTAFGFGTRATGDFSTAAGYNALASGPVSFATGRDTQASGGWSLATGQMTYAQGNYSVTSGFGCSASGSASLSAGIHLSSWGLACQTFGAYNTAMGDYSQALGYSATAETYAQTVIGQFNILPYNQWEDNTWRHSWNRTDEVFTIGNGTDQDHPSNAFVVKKSGDTTVYGKLTVSGTSNGGIVVTGTTDATTGIVVASGTNALVLIPQQGDLSMGEFHGGATPTAQ